MSVVALVVIHAAILAYAFVGGVFLAFSDFIMRSLALTSGAGGVEAMQAINREVFRWVFMALFIGLAAISLLLGVYGLVYVGGVSGALIALSGAVYVVGCFGVTVFRNVPLNETLAGMAHRDVNTQAYWSGTYLPRWTRWNTVRTVACALSAALLLTGVCTM
ncbi:MAG: anthrone oxygenase family protein [Pseudomonadota bacterium]